MGIQSLSSEQLLELLGAAKACRERDWLMILVGFWHGLRASEVIGLTADNIQDGRITVQRLKGSLKTCQELVDDPNPLLNERQPLTDYVRNLASNQRVFNLTRERFFQIVRQHAKTAGIPKRLAHPHVLKHTIAMQSIHDAGIENVRQRLGHKVISSTGVYLQTTDERADQAIRAAVHV